MAQPQTGRGHLVLIAKGENQHRQVDARKAFAGQRFYDFRIDDDGKADPRVAQFLRRRAKVDRMQVNSDGFAAMAC